MLNRIHKQIDVPILILKRCIFPLNILWLKLYFFSKMYQLEISTNRHSDLVTIEVDLSIRPELPAGQVIIAVCILVGLYVLIIFDVSVHFWIINSEKPDCFIWYPAHWSAS